MVSYDFWKSKERNILMINITIILNGIVNENFSESELGEEIFLLLGMMKHATNFTTSPDSNGHRFHHRQR